MDVDKDTVVSTGDPELCRDVVAGSVYAVDCIDVSNGVSVVDDIDGVEV